MANQTDMLENDFTKNMEALLFESVVMECIDFINLFALPAEKDILLELMTLTYNSFELPFYLPRSGIKKSLDLAIKDKYLIIGQKTIFFIPLNMEHVLVCTMLSSKAEFVNGNFYHIMEELLIADQPLMDLRLLLAVYNKASEHYHAYRSVFETIDRPKLSDSGRKLLIKKTLESINEDFELWYEIIDAKVIDVINNYFTVLDNIIKFTEFLPQKEDD